MKIRSMSLGLFSALAIVATGCGKKEAPPAKQYEAAADSSGNCTDSFISKNNDIVVQGRSLGAAMTANNQPMAIAAAKDMVKACDAFEASFSAESSCKAINESGDVEIIRASDKKGPCDVVRTLLVDSGNALVFSVERDLMQFTKSFK